MLQQPTGEAGTDKSLVSLPDRPSAALARSYARVRAFATRIRERLGRRTIWVLAAVAVVCLAGIFWRLHGRHRFHRASFKTARVERTNVVAKVTASGTLSALMTVQVGTQVSGRVQKLFVDFNSTVKKGDPVAKIDPQLFEAQVQQAQANYSAARAGIATARANAANAEKQYARAKALRQQNLASQADLDAAEAAAGVARANVDAAKASLAQSAAQLNQAQVNLSYTTIASPIDGVVISRSVDTGQTVAASLSAPTLFTIAHDLTKMQVDTNVAEGDVGRLQEGMKTYFSVDSFPGTNFLGTIRQIRNAPTTVQNVVTYDAVIDVDNSDLRLRPGMTANVTIVYDERPAALAVANAALRFRPPSALLASITRDERRSLREADGGPSSPSDRKTVWVLRDGGAHPVAIRIGLSDGAVSEVVDGALAEGEQVILDTVEPGAPPAGSAASPLRRMF